MNEKPRNSRQLFWIGVVVATIGALALLAWSRSAASSSGTVSSKPNLITISMDSAGAAKLGGVPIANTNIRDAAFSALAAAGVRAQFAVPPTITNQVQMSNMLETLQSMSRAGLFATNNPNAPSPYE